MFKQIQQVFVVDYIPGTVSFLVGNTDEEFRYKYGWSLERSIPWAFENDWEWLNYEEVVQNTDSMGVRVPAKWNTE